MPTQTPTWASIKADWPRDWKRKYIEAAAAYGSRILKAPEKYAATVQQFLQVTEGNAKALAAARSKMLLLKSAAEKETALQSDYSKRAKLWLTLQQDNQQLVAGLLADATLDSNLPETGAVPVLVVAGVAVSVAGVAWALAAMQYATATRERIALFSKELDARVAALNLGQTLPASTIGPMEPREGKGGGWMLPALLGLGITAGGGLLLFKFAK